MNKNALLGFMVFDKAVSFGFIKESDSTFSDEVGRIRLCLPGNANFYIFSFDFLLFTGIRRG